MQRKMREFNLFLTKLIPRTQFANGLLIIYWLGYELMLKLR